MVTPQHRLESMRIGTEAPVSTPVPAEHQRATESAAAKVMTGEALSPREQFALEAIIIPDKRPAIDIVDGDYNIGHPLWTHFNGADIKAKLRPTFTSIGRIELPDHPTLPYAGTGFVVAQDLVMTNRHVAEIFCDGRGVRDLVFRPGHKAAIDFLRENGRSASQLLKVREVAMIHPYWDMALLRVDGLAAGHPSLVLSLRHPEDMAGRDVAVVGYPAFDPRNDAKVQDTVFRGVYYVKRLQPGKLRQRGSLESFGKIVSAVTHDSSTLGGNSGSAVIDPATGEVVALHFAGVYLEANYAVPTAELARDARVVDTGVTFSATATSDPGVSRTWWSAADTGEASSVGRPGADDNQAPSPSGPDGASANPPRPQSSGPATSGAKAFGDGATWTIPVEITVRLGPAAGPASAATAQDAAAASLDAVEKMAEPIHDPDYSSRTGYDTEFLGVEVPPPAPTDKRLVARMDDDEYLIPYHHFSIAMHKRRRLALFTAANIDGSKLAKQPEPGKKFTRGSLGGLGKSDVEKWFTDPRIPQAHQLPDRFFTKDQGAFDKGHLVRREDVAWGASFEEVQLANGDTFHTTNCSPQVGKFNRPDQKSNWGELEKFISKQSDRERLCIFSGPVLSADDRMFVGVDDRGPISIQIPSQFWKVVVAAQGNKLQSFAFVLRQDLRGVPLEFAVTGVWRRHMISIRALEDLLKTVRFPEAVRRADQSASESGRRLRTEAAVEMVAPSDLPSMGRSSAVPPAATPPAMPPRTEAVLRAGPLTFRDHFLSLYQSAAAEVGKRAADASPKPATEAAAELGVRDPRAEVVLAAERIALARSSDRALSHSAAVPKEDFALEKMSVLDQAHTCAALGWELLQAKVLGDTSSERKLQAQLTASTCDPNWASTIAEYSKFFGPFGGRRDPLYVTPNKAGDKTIPIKTGAKVALIGDWGTGAQPARQLLERIKALQPDVLVHLGDIYYSGTESECRDNFETLVDQVFDRAHSQLPVYTLCGNHDMYCGGVGYYKLIKRLNKGPLMQPASFFCLRTQDQSWQLLAMDTGRHDYSPFSVTDVVTFVEPEEQNWLRARVQEFAGKTILLSHHQLFSAFSQIGKAGGDGMLRASNPQLQGTYDELVGTGKRIAAWFWGHEHNLCIYEPYGNLERGRCVGHSAVPVFAADTPYAPLANLPNPPRLVPNTELSIAGQLYAHGFAMLTLTAGAASAEYYEDINGGSRSIHRETIA